MNSSIEPIFIFELFEKNNHIFGLNPDKVSHFISLLEAQYITNSIHICICDEKDLIELKLPLIIVKQLKIFAQKHHFPITISQSQASTQVQLPSNEISSGNEEISIRKSPEQIYNEKVLIFQKKIESLGGKHISFEISKDGKQFTCPITNKSFSNSGIFKSSNFKKHYKAMLDKEKTGNLRQIYLNYMKSVKEYMKDKEFLEEEELISKITSTPNFLTLELYSKVIRKIYRQCTNNSIQTIFVHFSFSTMTVEA